jgi:nucleolar GTP-binding protein
MNFQDLKRIEDSKFYLEQAFKNSKQAGQKIFFKTSGLPLERIKKAESEKLKSFSESLINHLDGIIKNFPSIDSLPELYQELLRRTVDYDTLKKSLGSIKWVIDNLHKLVKPLPYNIRAARDAAAVKALMNMFYGRASSFMKQIDVYLKFIEESRAIMKSFPALKTDLFTVAITGYPNIGKSTLLSKITPAKPEIKDYSFTTKSLNQGYAPFGRRRVQFVDTPGVLGREKKNNIEEQAYLILKYAANLIVYVIDLTEPYPLKDQDTLFNGLKEYDKPIIVYLSKTDILKSEIVSKYKRKYRAAISIEDLKKRIEKAIKEYYFES